MFTPYRNGLLTGLAVGTMFTLGIMAPASGTGTEDDIPALVEAIRAASERFEDFNVALAEGYIPDPSGHCVTAAEEGLPAELGAMGVHYLRPDLLGITATEPRVDGVGIHTDFLQPSILLYEPQADGSLVLVGVENLVFEKAWRLAGNLEAPVLAGRSWDYMADDPTTAAEEAHGFVPHWDQHVWFRDNPLGPLVPFNPAVTCDHHLHAGHAH